MAPIYITPGENMFNIQFKKFLSIKHFFFFFKILVLFLLFLQFFRYLITKRFHLLWIDIVILFLSIISASSSLFVYDSLYKKVPSVKICFNLSSFCLLYSLPFSAQILHSLVFTAVPITTSGIYCFKLHVWASLKPCILMGKCSKWFHTDSSRFIF